MYRVEFITGTDSSMHARTIDIDEGTSLLEAALETGIDLPHECGGMATCGTCYIHVQQGNNYLEFKSRREIHCLVKHHHNPEVYRLACQCILVPGSGKLVISIPGNKSE